ncbi:Uncharacterized protein PCOAH_00012130 [Plasmodium coatneyi]|uniref:Uncharacterized protein n=1 Tax=Plasmodium coatneyi TaxID=208452 RepID=A0A1B1DVN2_9APIC|nr:Uncharacterized protein PCOAH_00012130 [Plasmodium coatneyi]ANQ06699.1 Uncharacterized protein PCOAH_00012130 [Plasmodium coatneyi]
MNMSERKSSLRYSSKNSFSYEKEVSSTTLQITKNRDEIIKNKVYCPIELKNVYKLLEDSDQLLSNKNLNLEYLLEHNSKVNEFLSLCEGYKVNLNNQSKPELKKTYNSIEKNMHYLNKHIETAKKDNIILKKKLKKSTDPLFISTLEQKYKQVCLDIENRKKEIKFLKDSIRKNEKLLDSNKRKPNKIALEKEYKNLLSQQSTLCSRLIQLQNGNRLYEENICKIDAQLDEIKKKMNELNIDTKREDDVLLSIENDASKENLERRIFNLNTKRDELKKEKNSYISSLNNTLAKLKKQISNLEEEKRNLLNEEKNNLDKHSILKRALNIKVLKNNRSEGKGKATFSRRNVTEKGAYTHKRTTDVYPEKREEETTWVNNVQIEEKHFIEQLLEDGNGHEISHEDVVPTALPERTKEDMCEEDHLSVPTQSKTFTQGNKHTDSQKAKRKKKKIFIPEFENDILMKLEKQVTEKLSRSEEVTEGVNEVNEEVTKEVNDEMNDAKDKVEDNKEGEHATEVTTEEATNNATEVTTEEVTQNAAEVTTEQDDNPPLESSYTKDLKKWRVTLDEDMRSEVEEVVEKYRGVQAGQEEESVQEVEDEQDGAEDMQENVEETQEEVESVQGEVEDTQEEADVQEEEVEGVQQEEVEDALEESTTGEAQNAVDDDDACDSLHDDLKDELGDDPSEVHEPVREPPESESPSPLQEQSDGEISEASIEMQKEKEQLESVMWNETEKSDDANKEVQPEDDTTGGPEKRDDAQSYLGEIGEEKSELHEMDRINSGEQKEKIPQSGGAVDSNEVDVNDLEEGDEPLDEVDSPADD